MTGRSYSDPNPTFASTEHENRSRSLALSAGSILRVPHALAAAQEVQTWKETDDGKPVCGPAGRQDASALKAAPD
jgi:hypothetical protein